MNTKIQKFSVQLVSFAFCALALSACPAAQIVTRIHPTTTPTNPTDTGDNDGDKGGDDTSTMDGNTAKTPSDSMSNTGEANNNGQTGAAPAKGTTNDDSSSAAAGKAATARLAAVQDIFAKHCYSCHAGFESLDDSDFQIGNYVVAGNPTSSEIWTRLRSTDGTGSHDMPRREGALPTADLAAIKAWITQMKALNAQ